MNFKNRLEYVLYLQTCYTSISFTNTRRISCCQKDEHRRSMMYFNICNTPTYTEVIDIHFTEEPYTCMYIKVVLEPFTYSTKPRVA